MCLEAQEQLKSVLDKYPQRVQLIESLHELLTCGDYSLVLIYGHRSTGKTSITRDVIKATNSCFSWTDCYEIDSTQGMEKKILIDLNLFMKETFNPCTKKLSVDDFVDSFVCLTDRISELTSISPVKSQPSTPVSHSPPSKSTTSGIRITRRSPNKSQPSTPIPHSPLSKSTTSGIRVTRRTPSKPQPSTPTQQFAKLNLAEVDSNVPAKISEESERSTPIRQSARLKSMGVTKSPAKIEGTTNAKRSLFSTPSTQSKLTSKNLNLEDDISSSSFNVSKNASSSSGIKTRSSNRVKSNACPSPYAEAFSSKRKTPKKKQESVEFKDTRCQNIYVILDNFDSLIRKKIDVLPSLNKLANSLRELRPNSSLMVILITCENYDTFIPHFGSVPRPFCFPFYHLDEQGLADVIYSLFHGESEEGEKQTLKNQINFMVKSVYTSFYDIPKLYRMVKKARRDSTCRTFKEFWNNNVDKSVASVVSMKSKSIEFSIQYLPLSMKYLLIACFIASNNSKASDKRFLVVKSDKKKVTRRKTTVSTDSRYFTLERLIHIYQAIIALNSCKYANQLTCITNSWFYQLEYLVQLKLLVKMPSVSIPPSSSLTKYRISDYLTPDLIMKISDNLDFTIKNYLETVR